MENLFINLMYTIRQKNLELVDAYISPKLDNHKLTFVLVVKTKKEGKRLATASFLSYDRDIERLFERAIRFYEHY